MQPVRDAAIKLNLVLRDKYGLKTFHVFNFALWIGILFIIDLILRKVFPWLRPMVAPAILLYSVHPVFVGSVAWISASKHLLSAFFILLATWLWLGGRSLIGVFIWYVLSIFSQPITILWPIWAWLHSLGAGKGYSKNARYLFFGLIGAV